MSSAVFELDRPEAARLGVHRSLEPPGALAHIAARLDATTPANEYEAELDVRMLAVDATSFKVIRERSSGDPQRMAGTIVQIVHERGKLQNPWTGSGGVLMGCVARVGGRRDDLTVGGLVVPLASLIAVPLTLDAVGPVDPGDHQVPVCGRAIVTGAMLCARMPSDLTETVALNALDVYPVASYVRDLGHAGGTRARARLRSRRLAGRSRRESGRRAGRHRDHAGRLRGRARAGDRGRSRRQCDRRRRHRPRVDRGRAGTAQARRQPT